MTEPVRGVAYDFPMALDSVASAGFQVNPTIAAGDFQISKDFGAYANLATLPVVTPAGTDQVKVSLSATEMTADKILIRAKDHAGGEWNEAIVTIDNPTGSSESTYDILVGDHVETRTSSVINKKGTSTALVSKRVGGSLLGDGVTITTVDS